MAKLSSDKKSVTVEKGDTLSQIASTYKDYIEGSTNSERINTLVKLNNIKDPDYIVVGQVIKLSGEATKETESTTSTVTISAFGLQSNTDRTVYVAWDWTKSNTDHYEVKWSYQTGTSDKDTDGVWFVGSETSVTTKNHAYTAPANAYKVSVTIKPVSKTHKVDGKDTAYWTAKWSTGKSYYFSHNPPVAPPVPSIKIEEYTITVSLNNLDPKALNCVGIQFQVVKNDEVVVYNGRSEIVTGYASYSCAAAAGATYKVRARSYTKDEAEYSAWSDYSESVKTIPAVSSGITVCRASSKTSVYLEWTAADAADSYDLEYATKREYLDGSNQTTQQTGIKTTHYELGGLESGSEYFFRVRSVNEAGTSEWSSIVSTVIGTKPTAPTTWSSTTTAIVGDPLYLYWIHNSEDGSSQTSAELEITAGGTTNTHTIKNTASEDEKDKTSVYEVNTSKYTAGTEILWRVRTAGVTNDYGDWSIQRVVTINAPATLEFRVTDASSNTLSRLTKFPFYVYAKGGPSSYTAIGYHLSVVSKTSYETVDDIGNYKYIGKGTVIYSKYFDVSGDIKVEFSANNIDLENNAQYEIQCVVTMDSGLSAEGSSTFTVAWNEIDYEPNAEIGIDKATAVAHIRPYIENGYGTSISNVYLSVYRREYDGGFTEIAKNLENGRNIYVTDPHPSLDYARYRIVATHKDTGAVSYYDVPGYPVGHHGIIIQWDEQWREFDAGDGTKLADPSWSGSMLKLPYNIDVTEKPKVDVSLVEYIGRTHPVSYYGTQRSESGTWKTDIDKTDKDTVYALRRLAIWPGNVYVREPSGIGYWANITVSMDQKHKDPIIPVTLEVTRVEGGM